VIGAANGAQYGIAMHFYWMAAVPATAPASSAGDVGCPRRRDGPAATRRRGGTVDALTEQTCTACRGDEPPLADAEIDELRPQVAEWDVLEEDGVKQLRRRFSFRTFADALEFTNAVGDLAEREGHHPAILTEWGAVTVTWWTHKIGGLHRNDFIAAAKTDELARR
jgi:4a-hydroxytetrahydrobiopterin dehydratase